MGLFIFVVWTGGFLAAIRDMRNETTHPITFCIIFATVWPVEIGFYIWRKIRPKKLFIDERYNKRSGNP